jgi:hypothetical protein
MSLIRMNFRNLTLYEDEEWGSTHMALYVTVRDNVGATVGTFRWNNAGGEVDETDTYALDNDPSNPNVIDVELPGISTITIEAYADDDQNWPTAASNENSLGSASVTFDSRLPGTMGSLTIGPTTTDEDDTGYQVVVEVTPIAAPAPARVRIRLKNLILYEDEEWGSTHMAVYVHARGPGLDQEIFRWNNAGGEVNEVNSYDLDNGSASTTITLDLTGPTLIWVEGYADDDQDWPSAGSNENSLGQANLTIDPGDPSTVGNRQLGPTRTDEDDTGYVINLSIDVLPPAGTGPNLSIVGIEVTQAIQHFRSALGRDNSLPLVASKATLVRVYLDSGLDAATGGGTVPGVTGTMTVNGTAIAPIATMTAQPIGSVNPANFTDTLNFLIPPNLVQGTLTITAQASVGTNLSNPETVTVTASPTNQLHIIVMRINVGAASAPTRPAYLAAVNRLPLVYPIATDPAVSIVYSLPPANEVWTNTEDLSNDDGMDDLLEDIEDTQEDYDDDYKLYGMTPDCAMGRYGMSKENQAIGFSCLLESIAHELGHLYDLDHAPCGGPDDPDDDFVPSNGLLGEVGVDVVGQVAFAPTTSDFMSYCGTTPCPCNGAGYEGQWVSAYHWNKLFNAFR